MSASPHVTIWSDRHGTRINAAREMSFTELERVLQKAPPATEKEKLPLLKLATFGELRTKKRSLRNDENVTAVYGIEGDYDGEEMPMQHAAEILSSAGVEALLYTSANHEIVDPPHSNGGPRWRVIVPLSKPLEGTTLELQKQHRHQVGVLNALLGGVLSDESFALSQSYFFGAIEGRPKPQIIRLTGRCLNQLEDMPTPKYPEVKAKKANGQSGDHATLDGVATGEHIYQVCLKYSGRLLSKGIPPDEAAELLRGYLLGHKTAWTKDGVTAPIWQETWDKLPAMIERAKDKNYAPQKSDPNAAPSPLMLLWFATLSEPNPQIQLVKNLLLARSLVVVFGESNSGKTYLVLDLGLAIAAGIPWRGKRTRRGLVIYIAGEGAASVRSRIAAYRIKYPGIAAGLAFAIIPQAVDFLNGEAIIALIETIKAAESECGEKVALVIVDTFSRSIPGGNENDAQDVGLAVFAADRIRLDTGACVLFVHHCGKDPAKGARGSSALRAGADTEILIEGQTGTRTAVVTKQRDLEIGEPMAFDLKQVTIGIDPDDGLDITACVVEHGDTPAPKAAPQMRGKAQRQLVAAMRERTKADSAKIWTLPDLRQIGRELGLHKNTARAAVDAIVTTTYLQPTIGGYTFVDGAPKC